ncbi:MAG: hypothetical protein IPM16_02045 [Chloroflexi bacterium]|nr:hypothetical protein [Chloroflexota bacterium]
MWKKLGRFGLMCAILAFTLVGMVAAQAEIPSVTVTITADGLTAPGALPEGYVNVTFDNTSEAPFVGVVFQLNDGVTMDDVFTSMAEGDPMGFLPLVRLKGGPGVMPGQSVTMTYALEAGNYALLNFFGEMPQVAAFNVTEGEDVTQVEPATDLNVVMTDFVFGLPATLPAGSSVWQLINSGSQWHELAIAPVDAGTTAEDVLALLAEGEESTLQQFPILMPIEAGGTVWVDVDLLPGTYAVICNLPDLANMEDMHIHYDLGMIQIVTVTADTVTYTDPNGLFTLDYPAALTAVRPDLAAEFGLPFPSVAFADSDDTLDLSTTAQLVPEGGWGIAAIFIPEAFFTAMEMPEDAPLIDRATVFVPQEGNAEGLVVAAINEITLANGAPAIQAEGAGETEDTYVVFTQAGDGLFVMVSMISAPGGRTAEMVDGLMTVVNSIQFTGTLEDIMAGMDGE